MLAVHEPVVVSDEELAAQFAELPEDLRLPMSRVQVDYSDREPILQSADTGADIDTWREDHPYSQRIARAEYDVEKRLLQIELLKLQRWIEASGQSLVMVFDGQYGAGKGGTIKRIAEHQKRGS